MTDRSTSPDRGTHAGTGHPPLPVLSGSPTQSVQSGKPPRQPEQPKPVRPTRRARICAALRGIGWRRAGAATLIGVASTLAFAPTPHGGWLQIPILAALFWLLARSSTRTQALATGFCFGIGNFVSGVYWLYISMHHYGEMPAVMALAALMLFSAYLAVYPALACGAWYVATPFASDVDPTLRGLPWVPLRLDLVPSRRTRIDRVARLWGSAILFGACWALGEWLRGTVFTGFPWLSIGYAQVDGPFSGFAALVGVYGVGFAAATSAALLAQCIAGWRLRAAFSALASGAATVVLIAAGIAGQMWHFTHPNAAPLTIRLLQGNVEQSIKFSQAGLDHSIAMYQKMITAKPADLIVTPETALPILINDTPAAFAEATRAFADSTGTSILLGAAGVTERNGKAAYTNSTFGLSPNQQLLYRYDKHHLVPFGEFVPWGFRWFVNLMQIPLGDFARGPVVQPPFTVKGVSFAINICYEDLFGEEIARSLREQHDAAGVLVNSTNLAWFGDTIALDQHLQISRMRALETQRPVVRATNTGTTAAINADGVVQARLPAETVGSLDATVQSMQGATPYILFGNAPVLWISLALLLGAFFARRRGSAAPGK